MWMGRLGALGVFALGVTLAISGLEIMSVSATPPSATQAVVICHATGMASRPYVKVEVDLPSGEYLDGGRGSRREDIIPPYTYGGFRYPGKNWTVRGQTIWLASCSTSGNAAMSADAVSVEAGRKADPSSVPSADAPDTGASEVVGILISAIGFLGMGLGLVASRRPEP
jgi:hypothetical protein